jgi:molecular chaperone GrpE
MKQEKTQNKKTAKEVKKLEKKLEKLQEEKDSVFAQLQRVSADYVNYQKRAPKQIADSVAYEKEQFVRALLNSIDNFERVLANSERGEDVESFIKGIQIVHDEIISTLKNLGVEQIEAAGAEFDPAMHEALMQRADADADDGVVLEEFQKGYKINGKVLRPTKVIVNKKAVEANEPSEGEE